MVVKNGCQETVSGGGISWAYASLHLAPDRITTPAPHHSVFYRPDALPAAQPTASKHLRKLSTLVTNCYSNGSDGMHCRSNTDRYILSCFGLPTHIQDRLTALCPGLLSENTRRNIQPHEDKEERFTETTRSIAWELIPFMVHTFYQIYTNISKQ